MFSIVAISLLAFVAHAEEHAADPIADLMKMVGETDSEKFTDMLTDKLVDKLSDKLSDHALATSSSTLSTHDDMIDVPYFGAVRQNDVAAALNSLGVDTENEQSLLGAVRQLSQDDLNRAANRGTAYEWMKYNSEVDQRMALEAEAAVALMNQRAGRGVDASNPSPQEEELAQTSTDSSSLSVVLLMACFVGLLLTLANRHFRASTVNKEAFMAGYSPIHA